MRSVNVFCNHSYLYPVGPLASTPLFYIMNQSFTRTRCFSGFSRFTRFMLGTWVTLQHVLAQPAPDDEPDTPRHIVACYSRTTTPAEKNYSPTLLELAALYWALVKTEQYTIGRHFSVYRPPRSYFYAFSTTPQLYARPLVPGPSTLRLHSHSQARCPQRCCRRPQSCPNNP